MYYFIVNPNSCSGSGLKIWNKVERYLETEGVSYHIYMTEGPGQAAEYAAQITRGCKEPRVIVVIGGDGTFNEVLDGMCFCNCITMGYIPAGTGNDLARGLKLPRSPIKGMKQILHPKYFKQIDYGVATYGEEAVRHRRFIVSAGIGLDAAVCHNLNYSGCKQFFGRIGLKRASYLMVAIKQYLKARPARGYILLDGVKRVEFNNIYFVSAQLQPYEGGGFRFSPSALYNDGVLDICVLSHSSKLEIISIALRAYFKRGKNKGMRIYNCKEAKVHLERPMAVHVDGESCQFQSEIEVRCIERAVRMIVG